MDKPIDVLVAKLHEAGLSPRERPTTKAGTGARYESRCPAHEDRKSSLSIAEADDGRVLIKCHAGCRVDEIVTALGLTMADLFPRREPRRTKLREITYEIRDADGHLVAEHIRCDYSDGSKDMFWKRDGKPGLHGLAVVDLPLYGAEDLRDLEPGATVALVEGEKARDALKARGIPAVATVTGASSTPSDEVLRVLLGFDVVSWADADDPGREHMAAVGQRLTALGDEPRWLEWAEAPAAGDAADYFERGGTVEGLQKLVEGAVPLHSVKSVEYVTGEWPEITPLGVDLPDLPPFPTHTLPPVLRRFVVGLARQIQVPVEMVASFCLAVVSLAICRRFVVRPWEGWTEPTVLYMAVIAPPGSRKSSIEAAATKPIYAIEAVLAEEAGPDVARAKARRDILKKALDEAIKKASKSPHDQSQSKEAEQLAVDFENASIPPRPRLITTNATNEALGRLLSEGGGRILIATSEGGEILAVAGGLYTKGKDNFDTLLKGWSADAISVDRKGTPRVYVNAPAIVAALMLQPSLLHEMSAHGSFRGRGLLGRFLFTLSSGGVGTRKARGEPLPEEATKSYHDMIEKLLRLPDVEGERGEVVPRELRFCGAAAAPLEAFFERLEEAQRDFGELAWMRDWASKAHGQSARVAGALHMARHFDERAPWALDVSEETVRHAVELIEYYREHAKAVFGSMDRDTDMVRAIKLADYVHRKQIKEATKRDLQRALPTVFPRSADLDGPLAILEDRGYAIVDQPEGRKGPGRAPSPKARFSPLWLRHIRQIRQKPPPGGDSVKSVESVSGGDVENEPPAIEEETF